MSMPKHALMIAYHFPPIRVSSGIQRTLKFATYLRDHGWTPIILTISPEAYPVTSDDQMDEIPRDIHVSRAWGLDAAKHLSVAGHYLKITALPDRYATWLPAAVWQGRNLIKKYSPQVIWSTYPIATAHNIGFYLHRWSGIPWVADFRDSMTEDNYPRDPVQRKYYLRIEKKTVNNCARAVFTAPSALEMYQTRYPNVPKRHWALIPNGYDDDNFVSAELMLAENPRPKRDKLLLVHSGILYPSERDPRCFFQAVERLKANGLINSNDLEIRLRATGHDDLYIPMLTDANISDIVHLEPAIPYEVALAEMLQADGLLLFQSAGCNHQIPAKLYEYLRTDRPILALIDPFGDTAVTLSEFQKYVAAPLDDANAIFNGFRQFLNNLTFLAESPSHKSDAKRYSRKSTAKALAKLFTELTL